MFYLIVFALFHCYSVSSNCRAVLSHNLGNRRLRNAIESSPTRESSRDTRGKRRILGNTRTMSRRCVSSQMSSSSSIYRDLRLESTEPRDEGSSLYQQTFDDGRKEAEGAYYGRQTVDGNGVHAFRHSVFQATTRDSPLPPSALDPSSSSPVSVSLPFDIPSRSSFSRSAVRSAGERRRDPICIGAPRWTPSVAAAAPIRTNNARDKYISGNTVECVTRRDKRNQMQQ